MHDLGLFIPNVLTHWFIYPFTSFLGTRFASTSTRPQTRTNAEICIEKMLKLTSRSLRGDCKHFESLIFTLDLEANYCGCKTIGSEHVSESAHQLHVPWDTGCPVSLSHVRPDNVGEEILEAGSYMRSRDANTATCLGQRILHTPPAQLLLVTLGRYHPSKLKFHKPLWRHCKLLDLNIPLKCQWYDGNLGILQPICSW